MGEEGYLRIEGKDEVMVPSTKEAFDKYSKSAIANDSDGLIELIGNNEAYFVKAGTKVLVLSNSSLGVREIRILDGQFTSRKGFVPMEFIYKQ